ncbi:MAG: protein translocase subunit SecD [Planctomycetales bacterium]
MTSLYGFLTGFCWLLVFFVAPVALGIGICRYLKVREYSAALSWVLLSVFLALLPFALAIVQTERRAYQDAEGEYVPYSKTKAGVDPETDLAVRKHADTDETLTQVELAPDDIERVDGRWVLSRDHDVDVLNETTFDLSRWNNAISYGIDLIGGTNLVYEIDEAKAKDDQIVIDSDLMDRLVGAVSRRVNPSGTKEIVVRRLGGTRIEIILPGADQAIVEQTKLDITQLGSLEFSIVANRQDHAVLIQRAEKTRGVDVLGDGEKVRAKWRPVAPNKDEQGREIPNTDFDGDPQIALRQRAGKAPGFKEVLILNEPDSSKQITGKLLKRANPTHDQNGKPAVGFHFNSTGAFLFQDLTTRYAPRKDGSTRRLAVMLNGEVFTAPSVRQPIGADGVIESGRFTQAEVDSLVSVLNAGALPVPIKSTPISEFTISPTLGSDVQSKGKMALWVSSIAVVVFMAAYYFTAGLVADLALLLNLLFIVSIMACVKAAFTLPGLAGLVLSAGMAVDANVLIYERMREELQRGASLRMAIHNGFDKAFAAIFDSNITTLITAVILYLIGTETVKGFAVALFIGLVLNLLTAVLFSRLIMNILERSRTIRKLRMLSLVGETHFDFVGKQMIASGASLVLIVAGLVALFARGDANYDIDFAGGISVTMQFNEPQKADNVRDSLEKTFGGNITLEELSSSGQIAKGTYFRLRVANEKGRNLSPQDVQSQVSQTFPEVLVRKDMHFGELVPIAATKAKPAEDDAEVQPPSSVDRFAGGTQVALTITNDQSQPDKIALPTFSRYLEEQLSAIERDGKQAYSNPDSLFVLEGTAGPGMTAREGSVKLYSGMTLRATAGIGPEDLHAALSTIQATMKETPVFDEVTSFESSVASETRQSALLAIIASLVAIVAYVWLRFESMVFGLAAVVALAHDVLVSVGCVALAAYLSKTPLGPILLLSDFKINMPMIAAFLTIVGYSLNDTIVIFDRLREIRGKNPQITREMINLTVNQTLSRTLLTAFTVFITVLILYILGGEGIHGFAFCMVIGSVAGTYSTVYIASPLVLWFMKHRPATGDRQREAKLQAQAVRA